MSQGGPSTGSLSRRRVGSVSHRGNDGLPPLETLNIQMPSNPQNALALKTAALSSTKSLFQTCSTLRKRLRCVEDFEQFLQQPPSAEPLDVVSHMCHLFRLGSPLCHLYNLLIPAFNNESSLLYSPAPPPKQIEYDFPPFYDSPDGVKNWAKRPENAKTCQKYIAMFCMAMKQRREENRWHDEIWALHELWGKSTGEEMEAYDSTGLMKVLHTVETILDNLPESAVSPLSPNTPYSGGSHHAYGSMSMASRHNRESYDIPFSMGGTGSGANAVANLAATMNGGVHIQNELQPVGDMPRTGPAANSAADANAFKSVEELVSSEKSYVQELEILVRYSNELLEKQIVSAETCHVMFSNLGKILDFHRKFLIKLETEYEPIQEGQGANAWAEGSWGRPFVTSEPEFDCYGPYCANYLDAITVVNEQMPHLLRGQDLPASDRPCLHPERELQAFMIKPIQRITKYGLLLGAILHATAKLDYPFRPELEEGSLAVKRIAASINEVTDFKAKQATVRELIDRVEDWKGHEVDKFGDLWLDDHFTVTKADQPRDYHVFLFDKMMLCCKDAVPERKDKKTKSGPMLRKDKSLSKSGLPEKRKLALKGRIFVSNICRATLSPAEPSDVYGAPRLTIGWAVPQRLPNGKMEDVEDSFIMIGKTEELMKKWSEKVTELAQVERRKVDEARSLRSARLSGQSSFGPPTPASEAPPFQFPPPLPQHTYANANGYYMEDDDDESGLRSGRTTPSVGTAATYVSAHPTTGRRVQSQQSMPIDRAELRARALTEDQYGPSMTQWRSQQPSAPPMPRMMSNMSSMSTMSNASEASFGTGLPPRGARSLASSRLGRAEEMDEEDSATSSIGALAMNRFGSGSARGMSRAPSHGITPSVPYPHPPALRSRSASTPNVFQMPKISPAGAPPLPHSATNNVSTWSQDPTPSHSPYSPPSQLATSSSTTLVGGTAYFTKRMSGSGKRSSGESHSTETSETSSQQSPATPYGTISGVSQLPMSVSRQNSGDGSNSSLLGYGPASSVLLKIRYADNTFMIGVQPDVNFSTLYAKVAKKIRYARPGSGPDQTVMLKWIDADDDEVTLRCDADVEAMFGDVRDSGMGWVQLIAR